MAFAPEDRRAWQDSEIMAEFEKMAKEANLLGGPPSEAFEPIPERIAAQPTWEDEDTQEPSDPADGRHAQFAEQGARLAESIARMAEDLALAGHVKAAYRLERALAAITDINGGE